MHLESTISVYPFGMIMPGRSYDGGAGYRYGFNGMEKDEELASGSSYDFGARMYDARIGRWMSVDPLSSKQPSWSAYKSFNCNPNYFIDPGGETEYEITVVVFEETGEVFTSMKVLDEYNLMTDGEVHGRLDNKAFKIPGEYNHYYDYAQVKVTTISADGATETVENSTEILFSLGAKEDEKVYFDGDEYGTVVNYAPFFEEVPDGAGVERLFGFEIKGAEGDVGNLDYSKHVLGTIDWGEFVMLNKAVNKGIQYKPSAGAIDWKDKDVQSNAETLKKLADRYAKIVAKGMKISDLLEEIESYEVCAGCGDKRNTSTTEYIPRDSILMQDAIIDTLSWKEFHKE